MATVVVKTLKAWIKRLPGRVKRTTYDEDINTIVTPTAPTATYTGPITRAHARQLNYQVLSFLGNDSNVHENMIGVREL